MILLCRITIRAPLEGTIQGLLPVGVDHLRAEMGLVVLKVEGVGSAQAERFAVVRGAGAKIPDGLDEAALVFHAVKVAVVDQPVGVAR